MKYLIFFICLFSCTGEPIYDNTNYKSIRSSVFCATTLAEIATDGNGKHTAYKVTSDSTTVFLEDKKVFTGAKNTPFAIETRDLGTYILVQFFENSTTHAATLPKQLNERVSIENLCK